MPDLIFAVAFIAMVAAPAMVATLGGRKEYNPGPAADPDQEPDTYPAVRPPKRPGERVIRPFSAQKSTLQNHGLIISDDATLPMHNGRGMSNR
jgi:hypothetical protein